MISAAFFGHVICAAGGFCTPWLLWGVRLLARRLRARSRHSTDRGSVRHPAYRRWKARRRLPEPVVAWLTDSEWPSLEQRLLSGETYRSEPDPNVWDAVDRQLLSNPRDLPREDRRWF